LLLGVVGGAYGLVDTDIVAVDDRGDPFAVRGIDGVLGDL